MNKVDLLFILDVTGSMGGLILDAQRRMKDMLKKLTEDYNLDLKVGLSLYRDHPSQESTFVTTIFNLVEVDKIKGIIDQVTVSGGGDEPEAVIDGIIDGVEAMSWRDSSRRISFLLGDAAPHGMVWDEPCCKCGRTWGDAVAILQSYNVILYSIAIGGLSGTEETFKTLSTFTGGMLLSENKKDYCKSDSDIFLPRGGKALDAVLKTLNDEFTDIDIGTKVLELLSEDRSPEEICKMLNINRERFSEIEIKTTF